MASSVAHDASSAPAAASESLVRDTVPDISLMRRAFTAMDTNKDGHVSFQEFSTYAATELRLGKPRARSALTQRQRRIRTDPERDADAADQPRRRKSKLLKGMSDGGEERARGAGVRRFGLSNASSRASRLTVRRFGLGSGNGSGPSLFSDVPLFLAEEETERLMQHAPPYGFRFGTFRPDELDAKRRNATLPRVRRYGSCAVVGSSGTLVRRSYGAEIDAHDAVWRVNSAVVNERYAEFAGRRTTVRVLASPHAGSDWRFKEQDAFPDTTAMVVCDRPYVLLVPKRGGCEETLFTAGGVNRYVYSCQNVLYATRKPNLHGINPLFYAAVRRATDRRKNAIPLTGVTAVAIATRMCRKVDVYAMSTLSGPPACYYYWYSKRGGGCTGGARSSDEWYHKRPGDAEFHDFRGNADALLQWNASGAIRIRV